MNGFFLRRAQSAFTRLLLIGLLAVVAVPLAVYGPMLLDLYRLDKVITGQSVAREAEVGPWPAVADACIACHGRNGQSINDWYPQLAGQPADYLAVQLRAFASGARDNPNMGPLARDLSPDEIEYLAKHFTAQRPQRIPGLVLDVQRRARGAALVATLGCASCHGADFAGQDAMPRLAGQGQQYLVRQLRDFQSGQRRDPGAVMNVLSARLSAEDIDDLASYLASYGEIE